MLQPVANPGSPMILTAGKPTSGGMPYAGNRENDGDKSQLSLTFTPKRISIATDKIKPTKCISDLGIKPSPLRLAVLERMGDAVFSIPITVNTRFEIIDGEARWVIAQRRHRKSMECEIYDYDEERTLQEILKKSTCGPSISKFSRVEIALRLEKYHQARAQKNRKLGGAKKQLLFLTEAERANVQRLVARDAGVSSSLVRQVKTILNSGPCPQLLSALRTEAIKVNRGYNLSKLSWKEQQNALQEKSLRRRNRETVDRLIATHVGKVERKNTIDGLKEIRSGLARLRDDPLLTNAQKKIATAISEVEALLGVGEATEGVPAS
jgi:hypothetical protein